MGAEYVNFVVARCSRSEIERNLSRFGKLVREQQDDEVVDMTVYAQSSSLYQRLDLGGTVFEYNGYLLQEEETKKNFVIIFESRRESIVELVRRSFNGTWVVVYGSDTGDDVLYMESSKGAMFGYRTEDYDCDKYETFRNKYTEISETYLS